MKELIPSAAVAKVVNALSHSIAKTATAYITPKFVVKATWRHKPTMKHTREEMVLTVGAPNYLDRIFVKQALKAGEPFPIKKVQLKAWPKKRKPKPSKK